MGKVFDDTGNLIINNEVGGSDELFFMRFKPHVFLKSWTIAPPPVENVMPFFRMMDRRQGNTPHQVDVHYNGVQNKISMYNDQNNNVFVIDFKNKETRWE